MRIKKHIRRILILGTLTGLVVYVYHTNEHFQEIANEGSKLIIIDHEDPFDMEEFCELISPKVKDFYLEAKDVFDTTPETIDDVKDAMQTVNDSLSALDNSLEQLDQADNTEKE